MSKYVTSDIHGCYEKFLKLLELIQFSEDDELYIIGDIFDRGPDPLKILDYILEHKNIILLKGNHEQMFEEAFETGDYSLWNCNGGLITSAALIKGGLDKEQQIYHYVRRLQVIKVIDKFILVHAGMFFADNYETLELKEFLEQQCGDYCLWARDNIGCEEQYKDYTVICGHTPVQSILDDSTDPKILKRHGTIYIDCGCCFEEANGKLACLRLDDMQEFYV